MYEYVKKSEYAPVRKELEQIINRVQVYMRKNYGLAFQFRLIGSGQRHLVTRTLRQLCKEQNTHSHRIQLLL